MFFFDEPKKKPEKIKFCGAKIKLGAKQNFGRINRQNDA
jgi:hypothetical protein